MSMLRFVNDRSLPEKRNFKTTIITFTDNTGLATAPATLLLNVNKNGEVNNAWDAASGVHGDAFKSSISTNTNNQNDIFDVNNDNSNFAFRNNNETNSDERDEEIPDEVDDIIVHLIKHNSALNNFRIAKKPNSNTTKSSPSSSAITPPSPTSLSPRKKPNNIHRDKKMNNNKECLKIISGLVIIIIILFFVLNLVVSNIFSIAGSDDNIKNAMDCY
nr:740_t:CDS:2 [Entrophospora candida]